MALLAVEAYAKRRGWSLFLLDRDGLAVGAGMVLLACA